MDPRKRQSMMKKSWKFPRFNKKQSLQKWIQENVKAMMKKSWKLQRKRKKID